MKNLRYNKKEDIFEWTDEKFGITASGNLELMVIKTALNSRKHFRKIWSLQDGYGVQGYTPSQGYDWSGIRDSSDGATLAMYHTALDNKQAAELNKKLIALKHN